MNNIHKRINIQKYNSTLVSLPNGLYIELMGENSMAELPEQRKKIGEEIFILFKEKNKKITSIEEVKTQIRVLKELPDNLVEQVYGHLQSEHKNRELYYQRHPENPSEGIDDFICAEGYINEILANIQIRQTRPELRGSTDPEIRARLDNYESKILSFANNPHRFGFETESTRNPDVAWLDLDEDGRVVIKGVGEITVTHQLNKRKFLQLSDTGFAQTLRFAARFLNSLEDGEKYGLPEFGKGKKKLEVASKIKTYLVVHHDMDTCSDGLLNSIGNAVSDAEYSHLSPIEKKKVFSQSEKEAFHRFLTSPDTVIIKSVFSNYDCHIITEFIIQKIKERYPDYQN